MANFTEKEIKQCMSECGFTREEAIECLEIESKMVKPKNYTATNTEKKKIERQKKADPDKEAIIKFLATSLEDWCDFNGTSLVTDVTIDNPTKLISFRYNGQPYSIDLKFSRNKAKAEGTYTPQNAK